MNHHFLDRDDFAEFVGARDAAMHLCPEFPEFHDYLPPGGFLAHDLLTYLAALIQHTRSQSKRPVFCEIYSRGRAGALRAAFGGFHIAQYRNPLNQFGSFIHLVLEQGWWAFLAFPVRELGISGMHPLYRLVPDAWRVPILPWSKGRSERWASEVEYMAMVASPRPETIENVFRWHMFSWFLSNLAAISYSDLVLDIDRVHEDAQYRACVIGDLAGIGVTADFNDLKKFNRYYKFESLDAAGVCDQVVSSIRNASDDGRLDQALRTLGRQPPVTPTTIAVELLLKTLNDSVASMAGSSDCRQISAADWGTIAEQKRRLWFDPTVRRLVQHVYPLAAPIFQAGRRAGFWN